MKKLITIAIPTYNRAEDLKRNLANLIPMVLEYSDYVEILISDNASTDNTKQIAVAYQLQYPDLIKYFQQNKNLGASPNFYFCIDNTDSDYVYLLGDDDIVLPNMLPTALSLIKDNPDVGLLHFNYMTASYDLKSCKLLRDSMHLPVEMLYDNGSDFILAHLTYPSFMSSNIFKKALWENGKSHLIEDCPGYEWFSILLFGAVDYKCIYYSLPVVIALSSPTGDNYSDKWVLYLIYAQGKLFKKLDEKVPGVFTAWQNFREKTMMRYLVLISSSGRNKILYRQKYNEIIEFIPRKKYKIYFFWCLYILPKFVSTKMMPLIFSVLRILSNNK